MWIKRHSFHWRVRGFNPVATSKGCAYLPYLIHQRVIQERLFDNRHMRLGSTGAQHPVWLADDKEIKQAKVAYTIIGGKIAYRGQ